MPKKIISVILSICLLFSVASAIENTDVENSLDAPSQFQQIPKKPSENFQQNNIPEGNFRQPQDIGRFGGGIQDENISLEEENPTGFWGFVKTYSTPITSLILLILAYVFVIFYKKKRY